jgi:hypothetical protein
VVEPMLERSLTAGHANVIAANATPITAIRTKVRYKDPMVLANWASESAARFPQSCMHARKASSFHAYLSITSVPS